MKKINMPDIKSISAMIAVYFVLRSLFYFFPVLKEWLFIFPAGAPVAFFYGSGSFLGGEWHYTFSSINITFGELCSGTTFYSLIIALLTYKYLKDHISIWWLIAGYPISLFMNASRVIISIYIFHIMQGTFDKEIQDMIHLAVGVVVYTIGLAGIVMCIDYKQLTNHFKEIKDDQV